MIQLLVIVKMLSDIMNTAPPAFAALEPKIELLLVISAKPLDTQMAPPRDLEPLAVALTIELPLVNFTPPP